MKTKLNYILNCLHDVFIGYPKMLIGFRFALLQLLERFLFQTNFEYTAKYIYTIVVPNVLDLM